MKLEKGLWVRARRMPMLESCYVEDGECGQYHMLGCTDLTAVVETFKVAYDGFAIVTTTGVEVLRAGKHGSQTMDNIRFGLQYLRENPKLFVPGMSKLCLLCAF